MEIAFRTILILSLITLTALIFYRSHLNRERLKLGLLSLSITYWIVSFEMLRMSITSFEVMFWAKSIFIAAPSAIVGMYALSREFRKEEIRAPKYHSKIIYTVFFLVVLFIAFTDKAITVGDPSAATIVDKAPIGKYFGFCMLFYLYVICAYFVNLIIAYKKTRKHRFKIIYIALSTIITLVVAIVTTGVLPVLGITNYVWFGPYSTTVFMGVLTYSILRYRLLDIDLLIRKTMILVAISTLVIAVNKMSFIFMDINADVITKTQLVYIVSLNLVLMVGLYFNQNTFELIAKRMFAKKKEKYITSVESDIRNLNKQLNVDGLIKNVNNIFIESMEITGTAIYLKADPSDEKLVKKTKGVHDLGFPVDIETSNCIVAYLTENNRILDKDELKHESKYNRVNNEEQKRIKEVVALLDSKYKSTIAIPLKPRDEVVGIIFLQSKKSGYQYTNAELLLLKTLAFNVSTLLDNIMLQQKTIHNEKLALIGTMASSFAHEIRNPLTSVSAYMGMLPNRLGDAKFMDQFLSIVPAEVDRVAKLTTDLMGFAKGSETNLISLDMKVLIERITKLVKNEVGKKGITINVGIEGNTRTVADENQLYQVLLNIVINALQASAEGQTIIINVTNVNAHTEIVIKDEGDGIDSVNLSKIFEPFYSTKIYGTGLGLATCKRIIEAHNGTIAVESEKGKGSTFTISIPNRLPEPV